MPCRDTICLKDKHNHEASKDNDHQNSNDCHTCSPFCTCNCCQSNTILVLENVFSKPQNKAIIITVLYKETPPKDIPFSIWQPPKINC